MTMLPPINFTEARLENGLRVILHEDHTTPIVAVNVWYHVGSKNEEPGRTGFAHLFEHMMFQGSLHHDQDYFVPLQKAGGTLNGSTNSDRTNYWEVVPSNFLELALWLESDRMGYLLEALTEEKLANQREVVKNERRQNYDNRPYGLAGEKIAAEMYPPEHPYHWLTIGSLADISAATRDDVSDFFRRFYLPNNASLAIAGSFDSREATRLVERYFGPLARGADPPPAAAPPATLAGEKRTVLEDRVSLPRLYLTWHGVRQWTEDDAALHTLAAILAGGKGSRLYQSLVHELQIAQDVSAFHGSRELGGQFQIVATAKTGKTLDELEEAINVELARVGTAPPSAEEMERAYNARESSFIYGLQTVGGFGGKSDQLNEYAVFLDQPGYFEEDLAGFRRVTAEDVVRVADTYLTDRRLLMAVTPGATGKPTTGDPAPAGPIRALPRPSRQTGIAVMSPATIAAQPSRTEAAAGAATAPEVVDRSAGVRPQTKAEADATTPAGATPPLTAAKHSVSETGSQTGPLIGTLYRAPRPGSDPHFSLPRIERGSLSNGLELLIVEDHRLPIIDMSLVWRAGSSADPQDLSGLASLTAGLLDEGTGRRSALEISNELAALGSRVSTGVSWDASGAYLLTIGRQLDKSLDIYLDVVTGPTFPGDELELQRSSRLTSIAQRRDSASEIARRIFASILYGPHHPYGHPRIGDDVSVSAMTDEHVRRFYETFYRPNNATLIVTGDVRADELVSRLDAALAGWSSHAIPATPIEEPPPRAGATIYLVDKPGAAQSVILIGQPGVPRSTPDFFPLRVMNTILGGQFTSRVNLNLREDKGYTYSAGTTFDFRLRAGTFMASASVQTEVTGPAVSELLKELSGIRGPVPITPDELESARQAIIRGFPRSFETSEQVAGRLVDLAVYGLPDNYFDSYIDRVREVTLEEVSRVAREYLNPSVMAIIVVGDRQKVESDLRSLPVVGASLTVLDVEGQVIS